MPLDAWLPEYDFAEHHETRIAAPPERVWASLLGLDVARLPLVRLLVALRGIGRPRRRTTLFDRLDGAFALLARDPPRKLVLGITGRFWTLRGGVLPSRPETFREPPPPGSARAAWSFTLTPERNGATRLETETRIRCADAAARRAFGRYWRVIRPGSGLIRRALLRAVRRDAERAEG
jgi:hypothetical protein